MEFEMPAELIKEVQIQFRKNAGLASFDPVNSTLPNLPSSSELISQMDPSPSYLRCRRCNGGLPRGLNSFFCVYCGKNQKNDLPPDPIAFRSTSGYRWLLESLGLDGSEIVEPYVKESQINKGQNALKKELCLSELLDLEIKWPIEEDKKASSVSNKSRISKSSVNLQGVDLDDFFSESRRDAFEPEEQNRSQTITASEIHENSNLFNDAQPAIAPSPESIKNEIDGTESGWKAEFQSASSAFTFEDSKSSDRFDWVEDEDCEPSSKEASDSKGMNLHGSSKLDCSADDLSNGSSSKHALPGNSISYSNGSGDIDGGARSLEMHDLSFMLANSLCIPPTKTT